MIPKPRPNRTSIPVEPSAHSRSLAGISSLRLDRARPATLLAARVPLALSVHQGIDCYSSRSHWEDRLATTGPSDRLRTTELRGPSPTTVRRRDGLVEEVHSVSDAVRSASQRTRGCDAHEALMTADVSSRGGGLSVCRGRHAALADDAFIVNDNQTAWLTFQHVNAHGHVLALRESRMRVAGDRNRATKYTEILFEH